MGIDTLPYVIKKSISIYADNVRKSDFANVGLFVEGFSRPTVLPQQRIELRFNTLKLQTLSSSRQATVQLNVLVHTTKNLEDKYAHEKNIGLGCLILPNGIPLYNGIGCLTRTTDLDIVHFGDTEDGTITQSTIEAVYEVLLNGN